MMTTMTLSLEAMTRKQVSSVLKVDKMVFVIPSKGCEYFVVSLAGLGLYYLATNLQLLPNHFSLSLSPGSKRKKLLKDSSKKSKKQAKNSDSEAGEETDEGDMESQEMDYFSTSSESENEEVKYNAMNVTLHYKLLPCSHTQ